MRLGALAAGSPSELFQLFVAASVFQPSRDTLILVQQRKMAAAEGKRLASATVVLNRTGDMGEIPTSAWLRGWKGGRFGRVLRESGRGKTRRWWPFW